MRNNTGLSPTGAAKVAMFVLSTGVTVCHGPLGDGLACTSNCGATAKSLTDHRRVTLLALRVMLVIWTQFVSARAATLPNQKTASSAIRPPAGKRVCF